MYKIILIYLLFSSNVTVNVILQIVPVVTVKHGGKKISLSPVNI